MLTRLTSLTSFAHLPNLEYLDISQNRIETLTGSNDKFYRYLLNIVLTDMLTKPLFNTNLDLHRLEHLREVFADDNLITCCYSVLRIPGLVKLSLRKNKLKSVDFESCDS
jgi:Leucine-rich repeat (LRR) protein